MSPAIGSGSLYFRSVKVVNDGETGIETTRGRGDRNGEEYVLSLRERSSKNVTDKEHGHYKKGVHPLC